MKCEDVQKLLHPFFDGELDVSARAKSRSIWPGAANAHCKRSSCDL